MKEESRIEALEHELKILKNEIQSTLLEIREQILNHYYPELRAEEPTHSASLPVRPTVGRPGLPPKAAPRSQEPVNTLSELAAKSQIQPFTDIFLEDLSDEDLPDKNMPGEDKDHDNPANSRPSAVDLTLLEDDEDEDDDSDLAVDLDAVDLDVEAGNQRQQPKGIQVVAGPRSSTGTAPKTREVNFRQLKQANAVTAKPVADSVASQRAEKAETAAPQSKQPSFAALATWVSDGVTKAGKERVLQVVETYATGGKLSAETKASLEQLISLASDDEPATPPGTQEMLALMVGLDQILRQ